MNKRLAPKYLMLGKIDRPHGIRGELRMRILTNYPERVRDLEKIYLSRQENGKQVVEHTITAARTHQGYLLLQLDGIDDRTTAELLRNNYVLIDIENAVPLEDGEVYLYQLIGLEVSTDDGLLLGEITDVLETGANDVYIVHGDLYGEVLIPAHSETILDINVDENTMLVKLPDGLLPETPNQANNNEE